jgi:hypothetical protein
MSDVTDIGEAREIASRIVEDMEYREMLACDAQHAKFMREMLEDEIMDLVSVDGGLGAEDDIATLQAARNYYERSAAFLTDEAAGQRGGL